MSKAMYSQLFTSNLVPAAKEETLEDLLIRVRTRIGNFRHGYNGDFNWWEDPEYRELISQRDQLKTGAYLVEEIQENAVN